MTKPALTVLQWLSPLEVAALRPGTLLRVESSTHDDLLFEGEYLTRVELAIVGIGRDEIPSPPPYPEPPHTPAYLPDGTPNPEWPPSYREIVAHAAWAAYRARQRAADPR